MSEKELDIKIGLAIAKGKNIIYYRKIDNRVRAQYIHVVRDYRKTLKALIDEMPDTPKYSDVRKFFESVVNVIDPKTKSDECIGVILEMEKIFYPNE